MKNLIALFCLAMLLAASPAVFANGVFQCTGTDGEVAFSFVPCAKPENLRETSRTNPAPVIPRMERLAQIDSDIASLEEKLQDTKRHYETSLSNSRGLARNDLTTEFDRSSSALIARLNALQNERQALATL